MKIFLTLLLLTYFPINAKDSKVPKLLLAKQYDSNIPQNISDYLVSEKLDGVRAYWDGTQLLSKQGNPFSAPSWFTSNLPKNTKLDGELWVSRNNFENTMSIVSSYDADWMTVKYMVFDLPHNMQKFNERYKNIKSIVNKINKPHIKFIKQEKITNNKDLQQRLKNIIDMGGEGVMLHKYNAKYHSGRSSDLLKLKPIYDAEAIVIGHTKGKGKNKGMLGALRVKLQDSDISFKIGTGFNNEQRKNPPKMGDIITFKYRGFTNSGIPKFASFLRVRVKN